MAGMASTCIGVGLEYPIDVSPSMSRSSKLKCENVKGLRLKSERSYVLKMVRQGKFRIITDGVPLGEFRPITISKDSLIIPELKIWPLAGVCGFILFSQ